METFLDQSLQEQLTKIFAELLHPVKVVFFSTTEKCDYCEQIEGLLAEVVDLSDKLSLQTLDITENQDRAKEYDVAEAPVFILTGEDQGKELDYHIRFYGMPGGHEFTSLINDLILVSRRDSGLAPETRSFLKTLKEPVHLQVFVLPAGGGSCPPDGSGERQDQCRYGRSHGIP
jgi:alkyl hydroperoxide reductase subunit AhpF